MYDRAAVVKKGNRYNYLVKHGSKNTFSIGRRIGNDFRPQYMQREARDSRWHLVAISEGVGRMADTKWNAPTAWIYGRISFGNKRNIALYLDKVKPIRYEDLDEAQRVGLDSVLATYERENYAEYVIDLADIKEEQERHSQHGDKQLEDYNIEFEGRLYWDLDNL